MSSGRRKSGRGERTISADEAAIWERVTRALAPVRAKPRVAGPPEAQRAQTPKASQPAAEARTTSAPPLAVFDRRQVRLIATGKIAIGARLDLHGCLERDARGRLRSFLLAAQEQGHTTVLVITGKGDPRRSPQDDGLDERPRGVLRRSVPQWLAEPDLRALVLSFAEASARHGGAGAIYVRLRRAAFRVAPR
jgi:DNA-nicking Smr family endonuclease